jgi:hypothetical protein
MSRIKRNKNELTATLIGCFVTPTEKRLIERIKPPEQSMSDFIRSMVLPIIKRRLTADIEASKSNRN